MRSIVLLAHNIRSLWNVGSFFRTADCFGIEKIWLSGYTAVPPRREISKTALGAEEWIPWEYRGDPLEVIAQHRSEGWRIVALERTAASVDITGYTVHENTLLILGHEVTGVPGDILAASDDIVHIRMHGKKESLNVSVAAGIALSQLTARSDS